VSVSPDEPGRDAALDADKLTWAVLLGRWVEFARGALALPEDEAGLALRESVADIIALQAVWFALQHIDELDSDERALGIARAGLLIDRHGEAVNARWRGQPMPTELSSLIADARDALAKLRQD
jgi:hypothetical protein